MENAQISQGDMKNKKELTKREIEVLEELCTGNSNREISNNLFISVITVKVHLKHIYEKLGVRNRSQAIILANKNNLLSSKGERG
ncbi:response regulator transcription factor [Evansella tamaricis]|uniref:LuxR C-terminal-related transcriptional regulator n=1 Tax=Evansella tamaricis TaxID=2069301 RepID=A0ABS6JIX5_9BACI|nr:LuxR C-terminal-related transcriptional regulator [Evansella tamaricis]MBU9713601.1 LuxR C-terminal-related transcriptional regulator [Evansella tamaricis]